MEKKDAIEAEKIVQRTLSNLMAIVRDKGAAGIAAKVIIGWTSANAMRLIAYDQLGYPLDQCFDLTRKAGASLPEMEGVRQKLHVEITKTLGATMIRDRSILMALAQEGKIISVMTFKSRQDVDYLIKHIQVPFNEAEELTANSMDPMDYRALVEMRAAIVNHLVSISRPLPMMLLYQFHKPMPSLVISHKLYGDASRYDEIRNENKIVHPAFCPMLGQALAV